MWERSSASKASMTRMGRLFKLWRRLSLCASLRIHVRSTFLKR